MNSVKIIIAALIGFALSYVPNNYMSEKYENIAFLIVVIAAVIGILWSVFSKKKQLTNDKV
jgi:membrane protein DedA with SNARE-associated domain